MIPGLRAAPFAAPIAELLRTRPIDHHDRSVAGPAGDLGVAVFQPRTRPGPGPEICVPHGGGMVVGDRFAGIAKVLAWAGAFGATVVSPDDRLAPEHPDPAPVEDGYAGLGWTVEHAARLGIAPARVLLAGTSAGGGLAAGVALLARDQGGPAPFAQLPMSPMLDDRNGTVSGRQYTRTGSWSRERNDTGWDALLGDRRRTGRVAASAAPSRATDPGGLPPAFVDVGSAEVFRDGAVASAGRPWAAGVQAEPHAWPGGFRILDGAAPAAAPSVAARETRTQWVGRMLGSAPASST
jgi:acetyl esterase/lipase